MLLILKLISNNKTTGKEGILEQMQPLIRVSADLQPSQCTLNPGAYRFYIEITDFFSSETLKRFTMQSSDLNTSFILALS